VAIGHDAQREVVRHFAIPIDSQNERLANMPHLMNATRAAELASSEWTQKAREYVAAL
jgi:hypothetical protein